MALFPVTAFVGNITYKTRTGVFYFEKGGSTLYSVVRGIPNDPTRQIAGCLWDGHFEQMGRMIAYPRVSSERERIANGLSLEVMAVLKEKVFAYWLEGQGTLWQDLFRDALSKL